MDSLASHHDDHHVTLTHHREQGRGGHEAVLEADIARGDPALPEASIQVSISLHHPEAAVPRHLQHAMVSSD